MKKNVGGGEAKERGTDREKETARARKRERGRRREGGRRKREARKKGCVCGGERETEEREGFHEARKRKRRKSPCTKITRENQLTKQKRTRKKTGENKRIIAYRGSENRGP
jgi:hypothetical protein